MPPKKTHSKANDKFFSPRLTRSKVKATTVSSSITYQNGAISLINTTTTTTSAASINPISTTINVANISNEVTISSSVLGDSEISEDSEIDELTDQINDLTVNFGEINKIDSDKFNITYEVLESLSAQEKVFIKLLIQIIRIIYIFDYQTSRYVDECNFSLTSKGNHRLHCDGHYYIRDGGLNKERKNNKI